MWGPRGPAPPNSSSSEPPPGLYSSIAPSDAGSYFSSASLPPSFDSPAVAGGSSRGEVSPRYLHLGEGDLHSLGVAAARLLLRAGVSLCIVGASAVRALSHGVLTPVALLGPAPPLHGALVVLRCVPLPVRGHCGSIWPHSLQWPHSTSGRTSS